MRILSIRIVALLIGATLLSGCNPAAKFDTEIRWTSYGIPHVKADDWGSLGYGFAYATATDAVCVIARDVQTVNGTLTDHFGAEEANLQSDIFHKAILTDAKLATFDTAQSARSQSFSEGYVAGYNRYLIDNRDALPASCAGADWVRPITIDDLTRLNLGVGIRYGLGRFREEIANASPADETAAVASAAWSLPEGIGSNAVAVGSALSTSGRGILLGNPHYPWHGPSRFHLIHTTIPGELDVMGTSLLNTSRVAIGFNKDIAWTHTVSTARRFTLYQLKLNPENPYDYRYEGEYRAMEKRTVEVAGETHTTYFTHFGPVLESKAAPWSDKHAYALRDAVIDNYMTADTYDALNKASSTKEVEAAISKQGIYWTNTIAADRHGNAFYADISGTPNVDQALLDRCRVEAVGLPERVVVLQGDRADCEWYDDPASAVAGALPPEKMPRLTRQDYVTNSNDSYWLSNPSAPLEGYSPIIGSERTARSLRTRAGLTQMAELIDRGEKIAPADIQDMLYNHRNFGAELLLDDVLVACADNDALSQTCEVLSNWDRTMHTTSRGSHLWREFWDEARKIPGIFAVPFDINDPVNTPAGINLEEPDVAQAVRGALLNAQTRLRDAGINLDAPLGDIQYALRNDKKIPIPGGEGWAGMFSMIVTRLQPEKGYTPIIHGNSYIQVISWDEQGTLRPTAMLTYSQSPEPESAHYSDLTEIYAAGGWIDLPFTEQEIAADPNLRRLHLTE